MNTNTPIDLRWANCGQVQEGHWRLAWAQLVGVHHRSLSEDSVAHRALAMGPTGMALGVAVADGVGGGARGDIASSVLVEHCIGAPSALFGDASGLASWMSKAEGEVQLKLREVSFLPGAATVVAAWLLPDGTGHLTWVGDTRAYRHHQPSQGEAAQRPTVTPLTQDQTYGYVQEEPPEGGSLHDPARMVGTGFMGEPEIQTLHLHPGQTLLLCSDGLHQGVDAAQIAQLMDNTADLADVARQLVQSAREHGSTDDITVLLVQRTPEATQTNHHQP